MNYLSDINEQLEHNFQMSFFLFLQVMQVYPYVVVQSPVDAQPNPAREPSGRMRDFIHSLETCETILSGIPSVIVSQSLLGPHIYRLEKNIHELVRLLNRLPFTRDDHEREHLMASIEHHAQGIRADYWEAIELSEGQADHLMKCETVRQVSVPSL